MRLTFRYFRIIGSFVLLISLFLMSCEQDEESAKLSLDQLDIQYLNGQISADLMPVVLPDPIFCQIELQMQNESEAQPFTNLKIPNAYVYLDSTHQLLGEIFFSTDWDGNLEVSDVDTVKLVKIFLQESPFQPPCNEIVCLELTIVAHDLNESRLFAVDSLLFGCTH